MEQITDPETIAECDELRAVLARVLHDEAPLPDVALSALTVLAAQTIDFLAENHGADVETLVDKMGNAVRVLIANRQSKGRKDS